MHYSSQPTDRCKSRSEPSTENSSDAPPPCRFGPLARRRPRPTSSRTAGGPLCPDVPGPDSRRGTGGAEAVNFPTSRCTTPAAAPRTGRGESALPRPDSGAKTQLPFAALPHDLRKDPRLRGKDKAITPGRRPARVCAHQALVLSHQRPAWPRIWAAANRPSAPPSPTSRTPAGSGSCSGPISPMAARFGCSGAGIRFPGERRRGPSRDRCRTPPSPLDPSPSRLDLPPSPVGPKVRRREESEERNVTDSLSTTRSSVRSPTRAATPPAGSGHPAVEAGHRPSPAHGAPHRAPEGPGPKPTGPSPRPAQGRPEGPSRGFPGPGPAECLAVGSLPDRYRLDRVLPQRARPGLPGPDAGRAASGGVHGCRPVPGQGASPGRSLPPLGPRGSRRPSRVRSTVRCTTRSSPRR